MAPRSGQMRYSIHDKTLAAKQARIFINAVVDCAKAGIKSSFVIKQMLSGISLYLECGRFTREQQSVLRRMLRATKAAEYAPLFRLMGYLAAMGVSSNTRPCFAASAISPSRNACRTASSFFASSIDK